MSLILKGIDMPKDYVLRIEIEPNGTVWEEGRDWIKHRQSAIQIDRPHGRLGDLDELASKCDEPNWCVWLNEIDDAPIILEAEE